MYDIKTTQPLMHPETTRAEPGQDTPPGYPTVWSGPPRPQDGQKPVGRILLTYRVNRDSLQQLFSNLAVAMAASGIFFCYDQHLLMVEAQKPRVVTARDLPVLLSRVVELRFLRLPPQGEPELLGYGLLDPELARAFIGGPELALLPTWSGSKRMGTDVVRNGLSELASVGPMKGADILLAAGSHPQAREPATASTWVERLEQLGLGHLLSDEETQRTERGKATWLAKVFARGLHQRLVLPNGVLELIRRYPRGPHGKPQYLFVAVSNGDVSLSEAPQWLQDSSSATGKVLFSPPFQEAHT